MPVAFIILLRIYNYFLRCMAFFNISKYLVYKTIEAGPHVVDLVELSC